METIVKVPYTVDEPESSYPTYEEWKQILENFGYDVEICSYPTYEEWKHNKYKEARKMIVVISSYPTYEEWKLRGVKNKKHDLKSSYPTYEEWKLNLVHLVNLAHLVFLSYL